MKIKEVVNMKYKLKYDLSDLLNSNFKVSLDEDVISSILSNINVKRGLLYKKLSNLKSQENKKVLSIKSSFLINWKYGKRIPLDCFNLLCNLSNSNINDYQHFIYAISSGCSKVDWKISFPLNLNERFFFISETIRTEGNIMKGKFINCPQGVAISNKDVFFLNLFEKNLKKLNVCGNFTKLLCVNIYLPEDTKINYVLNNDSNSKLHFHFKKGRLVFLDKVNNFNINNSYHISINGVREKVEVIVDNNNLVSVNSHLHSTAFVSLQVYSSVFARFLSEYFSIPFGIGYNKSYNIDFPFDINLLSDHLMKIILDVVISCEGHISKSGTKRIDIKLKNKYYLEKMMLILDRLNIKSSIFNLGAGFFLLRISKRRNLEKFSELIKLSVRYKQKDLLRLINSYDLSRVVYGERDLNYLSVLINRGPSTAKSVGNILGKKSNTALIDLNRLEKKQYVRKFGRKHNGRGSTPWTFEITKEGKLIYEDTKK
jgi:hypothetical protein